MDARIIQTGKATFNSTSGAIDAYASVLIQSVKADQAWSEEIIQDFGGFDAAWLARNEHITISLNFKLTAASKALAIANGTFLRPMAQVTLSGFDSPWLNVTGVGGLFTGSWHYHKGGVIDLQNDKVGGMEIGLKKYADPTQNVAAYTAAA